MPTWICREVLHAGEGPAKPERKLNPIVEIHDHAEAAEAFAEALVSRERRDDDLQDSDFDASSYYVEVRREDETAWRRFSVLVKCRLEYTAMEEGKGCSSET